MSIDFTLAPDSDTPPLADRANGDIYLVPITWISKHRITRFSLRDESDAALPALTQAQTAVIATACLTIASLERIHQRRGLVDRVRHRVPRQQTDALPLDVLEDFWTIASAKRKDAIAQLLRLAELPASISGPAAEESRYWRETLALDKDFIALANAAACNFLIITSLTGLKGRRRVVKLSYDEQRLSTPVGGSPTPSPLDQASGPLTRSDDKDISKLRQYIRQLQRFFGLRTKIIEVPASGIGHTQCFHLEVEVPEGIRLTHARLSGYSPVALREDGDERDVVEVAETDIVTRTSQCAHLHLSDIPRSFTGVGTIALRLHDELVLRGATINAALTVALLAVVAVFLGRFQDHTDATVAVLLGIPGGVALYLARPREPGMATAMHSGVRLLALGNAIVAYAAVAVVLAGGKCRMAPKSGEETCTSWKGTQPSVIVLALLAALMLVILAIGFYFTRRPPEHRQKIPASDIVAMASQEFG